LANIVPSDIPTNATTADSELEEIETIDLLLSTQQNGTLSENSINTNDSTLSLNGTGRYLTVTEEQLNDDLNQITISAWIKPDYIAGPPEFTVVSRENPVVISDDVLGFHHTVTGVIKPTEFAPDFCDPYVLQDSALSR